MEDFITKDIEALKDAEKLRHRNCVGITLGTFIERVKDLSEQLAQLMDSMKPGKALCKRICDLVSEELETATDGCVTVGRYVQSQMSKQTVSIFVGTHWVIVDTQQYYDWVKDSAYRAGLGSEYCEDPKFMNQLFEQTAFRVSRYRVYNIPDDEVWINLKNGTLELDSKGKVEFREHRKEDFFNYVLPYIYAPKAQCPLWHKVLDRVLPDTEQQTILGEYIGYTFTKSLRLEKCLILSGPGGNGKSVVSEVIISLLGDVNVSKVDWELLTTDENYRATCVGKLANISQENGQNVKHSILKNMVSGEAVMVRELYKDPYPTTDYGKLIALFNTLPKTESTNAYIRRLMILDFNQVISEEEKDVQLISKLREELPGILNWVLSHLQQLIQHKAFTKSVACEESVSNYLRDQNSALRYLEECCVVDDGGRLTVKDLFTDYRNFCLEEGLKNPFGRNTFIKILETQGVKKSKTNGVRYMHLKFKSEL